ncbi:MAG: Gfo/Idh/MocA family oxidoreductase [Chloroflexi bacterium]|nr:Gfo/Idh/MocA family oxidoreductase [Chloroflexota bacterium]
MAARPTVRVAIVGAGMIGQAHAHAFRALREAPYPPPAEVELTVVADPDAALAEAARRRFGFDRTASSWEAVAEAPDVDLVCVALPNFQHRPAVEAILAGRKHVLCEKPLANRRADAEAMLEAAERAGVVHGVGFNLRCAPAIAALRQAVERGAVGSISQFSGRYLTDYGASPEVPFSWRYERRQAGSGALGDIGSHLIDLSRYLVGELASVQGATLATFITARPVPVGHVTGHSRAATTGELRPVDTDDVAAFTGRFGSGAVGDFRFSRIATGFRNSPAFELIGSEGALAFDMERAAEYQVFGEVPGAGDNGFRRVVVGPQHPYFADVAAFPVAGVGYGYSETYVVQAAAFVRAVVEGRTDYRPNFADGVAVIGVAEAVMLAAQQGQAVELTTAGG